MKYDLIIIGSGPAGYVAAIRAGQTGLKTAIIEKENIGGMCLNWGCIPSKAMIESAKMYQKIQKDAKKFGIDGIDKKAVSFNWSKAVKRADGIVKRLTKGVEHLLKKNGVDIIKGKAEITAANSVTVENRNLQADNIIIATGSFMPPVDNLPEDVITDARNLFTDRDIPENIVVYGEDAVAVELAQLFSLIDKKVSLITPGEDLMPLADNYLSDFLRKKFKKDRIEIIQNIEPDKLAESYKDGRLTFGDKEIACDLIINAQTRKGTIPGFSIDIETENGFVKTNKHCETSVPGIWAIGDVNGMSRFAHIGSAQGLFVVDRINGVKAELNLKKYPLNMYSEPEMAQIGYTENDLKQEETDYKISEFPLSANGKAMTEGNSEGSLRILSEKKYGEVLGVQIIAPNATDMIAEAAAFMQLEATVYDIAMTVHAHPTVSEIFMEAGFEGVDGAIHK
jgi:dihydrolipoamide dehydrogenase